MAVPPPPHPPEPRRVAWRRIPVPFLAIIAALQILPGAALQGLQPALGLAWSGAFAFVLPAAIAATGGNLRPRPFLLGSGRPTPLALTLAFCAGVVGFFVAGAAMALATRLFPPDWVEAFDLSRLFRGPRGAVWSLVAVASLVAPLCEEIAFRGYLQRTLLSRMLPGQAIAVSAILFAALHLDPVGFLPRFVLGSIFGWLAWRSGSVWPAVLAHAANNGLASALALLTRDQAGGPDRAEPFGAAIFLLISTAALVLVARAFRQATPEPGEPQPGKLERIDPGAPTGGFDPRRIPGSLRAAAAGGVALWAALYWLLPRWLPTAQG
jgi:membrane protease YdiL (CAAX protease family)